MKAKYLLPLAVFLVLVGFLAAGLKLNPREVPSPLIGRAAPAFTAPYLIDPAVIDLAVKPNAEARKDLAPMEFTPQELMGKVWVMNVWASWCAPCREEHPLLLALQRQQVAPMVGLNYKDQAAQALSLLQRYGNPYSVSITDTDGRIGMDYGVYGVPETYVVDKQGVIRLKHTGALTVDDVQRKLLPLIAELNKS
ncbi:MAG: DsbE family thiol:disulfide interchange protein [Betaproteobacteria bacterium]|nr:DsbE family thiol:disulfide interchange protein [Betaproteobacteria bacterium]